MSDLFPMEMYHEILKRLPVRSLCRCRCVCKTWKSHIESRQFIAAHYANTFAAGDSHILWGTTTEYSCRYSEKPSFLLENKSESESESESGSGSESESESGRGSRSGSGSVRRPVSVEGQCKQKYVILESETYQSTMDFQFPFNFPSHLYKPVEILACVNGVLLLTVVTPYEGLVSHTVLWNPMVCRWIFLPQSQIRPKKHLSGLESLGFGYDPSNDDFRVVRLLYIRPGRGTPDSWKDTDFCTYDGVNVDVHPYKQWEWNEKRFDRPPEQVSVWPDWEGWPFFKGNAYCYPPKVEVCYVNERVWRRVNYDDDAVQVLSTFAGTLAQHQCYMNASVHWVARTYNKSNDNTYSTQLLVFNFESERFHSIKLPDQLAQLTPDQGHIASVAVFRGSLLISEYTRTANETAACCSLWLMRDYSDATSWAKLVSIPLDTCFDWVLWLSSTDDEILVCDMHGRLMLYDPLCAVYRVLGFKSPGELGLMSCPYACAFKESLYLLDEDLP